MNGEILAFIVYFVAIVGVGIYFFFKEKGEASYTNFFLGGRRMGPWVAAMSAQASDMSAWLLMGLPGSILAFGFGQMWIGIGLESRNSRQLDLRRKASEKTFQRSRRRHHGAAVSGQQIYGEEQYAAGDLRDHFLRMLYNICSVCIRGRSVRIYGHLPVPEFADGVNADLRTGYAADHILRRIQSGLLD